MANLVGQAAMIYVDNNNFFKMKIFSKAPITLISIPKLLNSMFLWTSARNTQNTMERIYVSHSVLSLFYLE